MQLCTCIRPLLANDSVQERIRVVRVRPAQEQSSLMASQPSVERLHTAEVRHLDQLGAIDHVSSPEQNRSRGIAQLPPTRRAGRSACATTELVAEGHDRPAALAAGRSLPHPLESRTSGAYERRGLYESGRFDCSDAVLADFCSKNLRDWPFPRGCVSWTGVAEGQQRFVGLPPLVDDDAICLERVWYLHERQASLSVSCLPVHLANADQVGVAILGRDDEMTRNDEHCASLAGS